MLRPGEKPFVVGRSSFIEFWADAPAGRRPQFAGRLE